MLATALLGPGGWAFGATVVGSMAFDYLYDKYGGKVVQFAGDVWNDAEKVVGDTAEKIWDSVGDAVNGFFSGLGSVFN